MAYWLNLSLVGEADLGLGSKLRTDANPSEKILIYVTYFFILSCFGFKTVLFSVF
jgi:hypothetical protein